MSILERVEVLTAASADARRAVGRFVLMNHATLDQYTIADIAEMSVSSKATVTRFAQALGYAGWREFIRDFMAEEHVRDQVVTKIDANFPFAPGDTEETIIRKLGQLKCEVIEETDEGLDRKALKQAAGYLEGARNVVVFGVNPNGYLGSLFCAKLASIGVRAYVAESGEERLRARSLEPADCAVLISYSGNNENAYPMRVVPLLSAREVPMIALTCRASNYLRRSVPCTLTISSRERLYTKVANFATETSIEHILDLLFACLFARNYHANLDRRVELLRDVEDGERSAILSPMRED